MKQHATIWHLLITAIGLSLGASIASAQKFADSSAFDNGELQNRQKQISKVLRLSFEGNSIGLDREWGSINRADKLKEETKKLIKRGMNDRVAARLAEKLVPGGFQGHALISTFSQIRSSLGGSYSQSGSTRRWRMSFTDNKMDGDIEFDDNSVILKIYERQGYKRTVLLKDDNRGKFSIEYSGKDFSLEFDQTDDGSITLVRKWYDEVEVTAGDNFADYQRRHAKLFNECLVPVLVHAGFDVPITFTSPAVKQAVIQKLLILQQRQPLEFVDLLKKLNSDDFNIRDQATDVLREQQDLWSDKIDNALKNQKLSAEVENRLKLLLMQSSKRNSVAAIVSNFDLLNDPKYLIGLFELARPQECDAIIEQLQKTTGLDYQTIDQWRSYMDGIEKK